MSRPSRNRNPSTWTYNYADQLTARPGYMYDYDYRGNVTFQSDDSFNTQKYYEYTPTNLVSSVQHLNVQGEPESTMTWDADGNRISFTDSDDFETTQFVYDTTAGIPAVIEEVAGGSVYYIREPSGALIARVEGETTHYYHFDALGSTRVLTDGNGAKTDEYTYDAWGKLTNHTTYTGSVPQPYMYVGQLGYYSHYQDAYLFDESGWQMLQLGVRFYDPEIGRFTQHGSPYTYASNKPTGAISVPEQKPVEVNDPRFPEPKPHGPLGSALAWRCIERAKNNAFRGQLKYFPIGTPGSDMGGPGDAFRHCLWACLVRKTCGADAYNSGVIDHETGDAWWGNGVTWVPHPVTGPGDAGGYWKPLPGDWHDVYSPMDLANDEMGRKCSETGKSCEQCCLQNVKCGNLYALPEHLWQ